MDKSPPPGPRPPGEEEKRAQRRNKLFRRQSFHEQQYCYAQFISETVLILKKISFLTTISQGKTFLRNTSYSPHILVFQILQMFTRFTIYYSHYFQRIYWFQWIDNIRKKRWKVLLLLLFFLLLQSVCVVVVVLQSVDQVCRIQMDIKDRERARKKMGPITVVR